jgi:hypothetical protein
MNLVLSIGVALTLAIPAGMAIAWAMDIRDWNGGVCRKCANRWAWFDNDSQGGRGYKCKGGHTVWISYPWVDKV